MPRRVLLTGSSGAIGAATIAELQRQGYEVLGVDKQPPPEGGPEPDSFVLADVTSDSGLDSVADAAGDLWGFVHGAGIYPIVGLEDYTEQLWTEVNAVNAAAAFRLVQLLRPRFEPGGRVVMIASGAGHLGSRDPGYAASKAALLGLVRSLAVELGSEQILVNAVTPGVIDTPMSARMSNDRREHHEAGTVLGRAGRPSEVAVVVGFLLDSRNTYMTGASIDVNGGLYAR